MMTANLHTPGTLIHARGREWIVLTGSDAESLRVRPLTGSEEDFTIIDTLIETEAVREARFPHPQPHDLTSHDAALLLRDALLLSLRRGAGPFRAVGQIAVEPHAYQLVPLMMALRLETVRLLVADDVGIGKTIEAALIARELIDRGDIDRFVVLCPPHLVDQWVHELESRFNLRAAAVTAHSAARLERGLPQGESIFSVYPYTVVSLDYIKSDARRAEFVRACPELVIVDEAHACVGQAGARHKRYGLMRELADDAERHMVFLTATPHSGDELAFYRLLGLLNRDFDALGDVGEEQRVRIRERLARHLVQRRRPDIDEYRTGHVFPRRETRELTYKLTGPWERFLEDVLDYCASVVESLEGDERRQRLGFWGTLAIMRCAASSPAAAISALRARANSDLPDAAELLEERVLDGDSDSLSANDLEPEAGAEHPALDALIRQAEALAGQGGDPKLKQLADHLTVLLREGFSPVVFCRYIATAHYLAEHLDGVLKDATIGVVTGEIGNDERREKVAALAEADRRVLIATDCLSEGINLQESFDAVVHYDLSWNPTRHEQREGRVDRFGQSGPVRDANGRTIVRATLMYGANNPVDGAVLDVILRKAQKIREELGVPVPIPDDGHTLTTALLRAVMLKRRGATDTASARQLALFEDEWVKTTDRARANRTIFAQRRLKADDVLVEYRNALAAVGGADDVARFVGRALARLGVTLESGKRGHRAVFGSLATDVRERLAAEGVEGSWRLAFAPPVPAGARLIHRSHPVVSVLAESLLERTLAGEWGEADPTRLGRAGCWRAEGVERATVVLLLRLRHQLTTQRARRTRQNLVEEAQLLAFVHGSDVPLTGDAALAVLNAPVAAEVPAAIRDKQLNAAIESLGARRPQLDAFAELRAAQLLADHERVRAAADAAGSASVKATLPADIIGLYVILPAL
jgi:superfamily II DNA or RNA helicase